MVGEINGRQVLMRVNGMGSRVQVEPFIPAVKLGTFSGYSRKK